MNSLVRRSQNLRCVALVTALIFRLGGTTTLRCQRSDRARSFAFITHVISANFLSNQDIPMPEQNAVKAYLANEDEMLAVTARSIVLEFPNGDMVEICWEPPHANDRRPLAIEIWGGRPLRPRKSSRACGSVYHLIRAAERRKSCDGPAPILSSPAG